MPIKRKGKRVELVRNCGYVSSGIPTAFCFAEVRLSDTQPAVNCPMCGGASLVPGEDCPQCGETIKTANEESEDERPGSLIFNILLLLFFGTGAVHGTIQIARGERSWIEIGYTLVSIYVVVLCLRDVRKILTRSE